MLSHRASRLFGAIACSLMLVLFFTPAAQGGMVGTERILNDTDTQRREFSRTLQRAEVRDRLQEMGVAVENVRQRVERLTDAEVAHLHQQMDSLPAGGNLSTVELLLIIILIVLLV